MSNSSNILSICDISKVIPLNIQFLTNKAELLAMNRPDKSAFNNTGDLLYHKLLGKVKTHSTNLVNSVPEHTSLYYESYVSEFDELRTQLTEYIIRVKSHFGKLNAKQQAEFVNFMEPVVEFILHLYSMLFDVYKYVIKMSEQGYTFSTNAYKEYFDQTKYLIKLAFSDH